MQMSRNDLLNLFRQVAENLLSCVQYIDQFTRIVPMFVADRIQLCDLRFRQMYVCHSLIHLFSL